MTDNLELKGTVCPICGYEFKFGTHDEIEFHRVICVPSDDWEEMMMTNREAIEWIKDMREQNWYIYNCERYHIEALSLAIEALEKQMPESIDLEGDGYEDGVIIYDIWICPRCGKHYELEYDYYDFCPNCGQRIDWSNKDDE